LHIHRISFWLAGLDRSVDIVSQIIFTTEVDLVDTPEVKAKVVSSGPVLWDFLAAARLMVANEGIAMRTFAVNGPLMSNQVVFCGEAVRASATVRVFTPIWFFMFFKMLPRTKLATS
jgi:hypothetical protein